MTSSPHPPDRSHCLNCGARVVGPFCHECGQRAVAPVPTLGEFLGEAFRGVSNLETRLVGTLRTLLLRPGRLTSEYLEGRRVAHVSPIRIYLIASLALGAATVFADDVLNVSLQGQEPDRALWLRTWLWSVLVMMPVSAGLLALAIRRGHRFVEHLVFAMHVHAFGFLLAAVVLATAEIEATRVVGVAMLLAAPPATLLYLVLALRHRYRLSWVRAVAIGLFVAAAFGFLQMATLIATGYLLAGSGG